MIGRAHTLTRSHTIKNFRGKIRKEMEPTNGLEPLTC